MKNGVKRPTPLAQLITALRLDGFPTPPDTDARYIARQELLEKDQNLTLVRGASRVTKEALMVQRAFRNSGRSNRLTVSFKSPYIAWKPVGTSSQSNQCENCARHEPANIFLFSRRVRYSQCPGHRWRTRPSMIVKTFRTSSPRRQL
jgi:hypothetical protein